MSARCVPRTSFVIRLAPFLWLTALTAFPRSDLHAQGVTTAGIRGTVRTGTAATGQAARVSVIHDATGHVVEVDVRHGRFLVQGLEPGGPYAITIRSVGFVPQRLEGLSLVLGELRELEFVLDPIPVDLDTVRVLAREPAQDAAVAHGGTATAIPESVLRRLPTLNRDLYDFVRLVPQVSTKISLSNPGFSAGGVGFRFNNFLINGVSERTLSGNVSNAFAGSRSVPLDAVQEYQVLIAPYDVRYGDFAGALVNTITKSGTNQVRGSAFAYARNDRVARRDTSSTPYDRLQYGFSLGGPIVRNRVHFFIAPEVQDLTLPAPGPYVGQPESAERPVPVNSDDLTRLEDIMRGYQLVAGSGGAVENRNQLTNVFTRLDVALPAWKSRAILWHNYGAGENVAFSRAALDDFPLSSNLSAGVPMLRVGSLQLHTTLPRAGGGHNELLVAIREDALGSRPSVRQPLVRVSVPSVDGGRVTVTTGTPETGQGGGFRASSIQLRDNLTVPVGSTHVLAIGFDVEGFRVQRRGLSGSYGTWTFSSLDALALGVADRYDVARDFGSAGVPISGMQYAAYVGDQWRAGDRLQLTLGIRADMLRINERAPYNALVDSLFARRTDEMPRRRLELSPRAGFIWDPGGDGVGRVRGGVGIFTGRPPLAWAHTAVLSYGVSGTVRCGPLLTDFGPPPGFVPDYRASPTDCAGGPTSTPPGDVDLLDRNLRVMRTLRGSLAYDRQLPWKLLLTGEAVATRGISDFVFVNLNLIDSDVMDRHGRVMYGAIASSGVATPALRSGFAEVIDLQNTSRNRAYQVSARLERRFSSGIAGTASYTYSRVRDVQTPLRVNTRGIVAWASARAFSGVHDNPRAGISSNDLPHRTVLAGTYALPWSRWRTEVSFYYVGESGRPFTYVASGIGRRGDLNADGSNANDPIYVPRNALDTNESRFSGVSAAAGADNSPAAQAEREGSQRAAFEQLIEQTPCLRAQRGRILERNSCREPWSSTTAASFRQVILVAGRSVEAEFGIFNVLNLLSSRWGLRREASPAILEHVGQTGDPVQEAHSIFRLNRAAAQWTTLPGESAYQLQFALRYGF